MKTTGAVAAIMMVLSLGATSTAFACDASAWSVSQDKAKGTTYGVNNGSVHLDMGLTEKQAEKLAKELNKIEAKDEKRAEG